MYIMRLILVSVLLAVLAACGRNTAAEQYAPAAAMEAAVDSDASGEVAQEGKAGDATALMDSVVASQKVTGRQLVLAAAVEFETENVRQAVAAIEEATVTGGGFVQYSGIKTHVLEVRDYPQQDGTLLRIRRYVHHGDMTVRIPRDRAAEWLRQLQSHIRFLNSQSFSATDVSLDLRRQQLAAERERALSGRLGEVADSDEDSDKKGTGRVVQQQFDARAAAEYARLQQAYWQDQVDFATVRLTFVQPEALVRQPLPDSEQLLRQYRPGFWAAAVYMLEQGWYGLIQAALVTVALWPLWLLLVGAIAAWRYLRRRKRRKLSQNT